MISVSASPLRASMTVHFRQDYIVELPFQQRPDGLATLLPPFFRLPADFHDCLDRFLTNTCRDTVLQLFLQYNQFELPQQYLDGGEALCLWKAGCVLELVYGLLDESRQTRLRMLARKRTLLLEKSELRDQLSHAMIRPSTPPLWEECW